MAPTRRIHAPVLQLLIIAVIGAGAEVPAQDSSARPPAPTLSTPSGPARAVDARGFIRRWLVLEPIAVRGQLAEGAVREALQAGALEVAPTAVPAPGDVVSRDPPLRWHAVDTDRYNVNLYHFAWALSKPTSNALFWAITVVDSPVEMAGVRLAICSNAASSWWFNGEPVIALYNDRQSVIDDGVSKRLTLRKGRNVIRAAIINGGGATDFCARFLDVNDQPIKGLAVTLQAR